MKKVAIPFFRPDLSGGEIGKVVGVVGDAFDGPLCAEWIGEDGEPTIGGPRLNMTMTELAPCFWVKGAVAIGEGADAPGAALDVVIKPLEAVRRADTRWTLAGERVEVRGDDAAVLEVTQDLRNLPSEALG